MGKNNPKLNAVKRELTGRKVRKLRREGILPASIYGHEFEPMSIQFNAKEFNKIFAHVGESGLVDLDIDGKIYPVIFRNPQYQPVWNEMIHIDCYKVNLKEKITATIPLELIGESAAVKAGNILVPVTEEIEVEALPGDLPEKIEVDITVLETLESIITVADLKIDREKIEIKTDPTQVVAKVEEPRAEIIEEPAAEEVPVEVPATEQKTPEELAAAEEEKDKEKEKK